MRSLELINRALHTAEDLKSIVRTMKVLAAVSIRQYERAVESLADYTRTVNLGIEILARHHHQTFVKPPSTGVEIGVIVFGSDHGLCGSFNKALSNFVLDKLNIMDVPVDKCRILSIGARLSMTLEARNIDMDECFFIPGSVAEITPSVRQILIKLDGWRTQGVERVLLFYNIRTSSDRSDPTLLNLLPIDMERFKNLKTQP